MAHPKQWATLITQTWKINENDKKKKRDRAKILQVSLTNIVSNRNFFSRSIQINFNASRKRNRLHIFMRIYIFATFYEWRLTKGAVLRRQIFQKRTEIRSFCRLDEYPVNFQKKKKKKRLFTKMSLIAKVSKWTVIFGFQRIIASGTIFLLFQADKVKHLRWQLVRGP